jgi:hypothetical protein
MGRNRLALAEGESLASEGGKKGGIGCVMQALKCSSRATKEDNIMASAPLSLLHDGVVDTDWIDFGTANADFSANAFRLPASSSRGDSNVPQQNTHIECDDTNNATTELEKAVDHIPLTVNRISSEDTHDTHDTPPASNLDPNRPSADELSPKVNKLQLDAICSKYFNTPVGQPMHSMAPLGDSIESPIEEDDEEEEEQEATPSELNEAKVLLQIPKMGARFVRTESEVSSLLGESISEEKKTTDEQLFLNPDNASVKIGYQEVKATKSKDDSIPTRTLMRPSQKAAHRDSWKSESSSYSSVSTFSALRSNTPLSFEETAEPLTPHTFFWRTYPKVTVTSYNYNTHNTQQTRSSNQRIPPKIDEERGTDMTALAPPSTSMGRQAKGPKYVSMDEIRSEAGCAPFLNSDVVRKLWMENRPFRLDINSNEKAEDQESQNPQPTRPRQLVQSFASLRLPAVFNRGEEIQKPENLNFAMG